MNAETEARSALRAYLVDHGLEPWLADGPVGARYRAMRDDGEARSPADAFGRWFASHIGGLPGEAESLGWIAWLIVGRPADELLGDLDDATVAKLKLHAPTPPFMAPLAMPIQELRRFRGRARTGASGGRLPAAGAPAGRPA